MWPWIVRGGVFVVSWVAGNKVEGLVKDYFEKRLIDYSRKWKIYTLTKTDKENDARFMVSTALKRENTGEPAAHMEDRFKWYAVQHPNKEWHWVKLDFKNQKAWIYPRDRVANFEIVGNIDEIEDFEIFFPKVS